MGTFHLAIQVGSPDGSSYEWMEALVATGSSYTVVPAATLRALGVTPARKQPFKYADGRVMERDVGQTWVKINDQALVRVVVFGEGGDESLLGADTLEGFGLGVDPIGPAACADARAADVLLAPNPSNAILDVFKPSACRPPY